MEQEECKPRRRQILHYDNGKEPFPNLRRLLTAEPRLYEKLDAAAVIDKKYVQSLYYSVLEEAVIDFATEMKEADRGDMYDAMLVFLQRVRFDRPSYEEAVAEFVDKQKMYAKTRNSLVDTVGGSREPEPDFVRAYRKEYYK